MTEITSKTFRFYSPQAAKQFHGDQLRLNRAEVLQLIGQDVLVTTKMMDSAVRNASDYSGYPVEDFEELD